MKSDDWTQNANGNYVQVLDDGVMTVFRRHDGWWAGVHDGLFTHTDFETAEEAMKAMEDAVFNGQTGLLVPPRPAPPSNWRTTKKGG